MSSPHRFASLLTLPLSLCFALFAALPAAAQTAVDPAGSGASSILAKRLEHARQHFEEILQAIPALPADFAKVGRSLSDAAGSDGVLRILLGAVLCLAAGVALEWGFRRATHGPRTRRSAIPIRQLADRLTRVGMDALLDIGAVLAFAVGALVVLAALSWSPPIHEAGLALLTGLVGARLADALLCILLRPRPGLDRELAAFDLDVGRARFWRSRLLAFMAWFFFGWAVIAALRVLGLPRGGLQLFAYLLGTGLVAIAIAMIWHPSPPAPSDGPAPSACRPAMRAPGWRRSVPWCSGWCGRPAPCRSSGSSPSSSACRSPSARPAAPRATCCGLSPGRTGRPAPVGPGGVRRAGPARRADRRRASASCCGAGASTSARWPSRRTPSPAWCAARCTR